MNKKARLDELYYEKGRQMTNFKLCYTFKSNGDVCFSRWHDYLKVQEHPYLLRQVNQRQQLNNEIILDLDNKQSYTDLIHKLQDDGYKFSAYETKSHRAQHIHLYFNNLSHLTPYHRRQKRIKFIALYGCDRHLSTDKHMIPLEYCKHWKTGEIKRMIYSIDGVNMI